jgi:rhodanese-related sulfurtransferase
VSRKATFNLNDVCFSAEERAYAAPMTNRLTIDEMLARARARITRLSPREAALAVDAGALLVDTRDSADRVAEGVIPGSILVTRNTLEWRADPTAEMPDPRIADPTLQLIVVCNDGYSSSLAAASLVDLGFARAADLEGGYRAWKAAGLPTVAAEET